MASRFLNVSKRVSPFFVALKSTFIFKKSAESLFAANSKVVLVLVLASKNKLTIVFPLKRGTFFTGCPETPAKDSAKSKISSISGFDKYSISKK